jgi:hypothetical protein
VLVVYFSLVSGAYGCDSPQAIIDLRNSSVPIDESDRHEWWYNYLNKPPDAIPDAQPSLDSLLWTEMQLD